MPKPTDYWMPFYVVDYLRDTSRLDAKGHGAYLLLIFDYWIHGPLPDDDRQLAAVTKLTRSEWARMRQILEPFFQLREGRWHHKRINFERGKASEIVSQRRAAGILSGEARKRKKQTLTGTRVQFSLEKTAENGNEIATGAPTNGQREGQQTGRPLVSKKEERPIQVKKEQEGLKQGDTSPPDPAPLPANVVSIGGRA